MAIKINLFLNCTILAMVITFQGIRGLSVVVSPSPSAEVVSGQTLSITCLWSADYTGPNAVVNYKLNGNVTVIGSMFIHFGTACPSTPPYTFTCNRDTRTLGIQIPANSYSHGDRWTCEGRNDNYDYDTPPQTDTTTVDVTVHVTSVTITPSTTVTVDVGTSTTLTCTTQPHSRPTASVTWYRVVSGQPQQIIANISVSHDTQNSAQTTTSALSYVPSKEDNGRTVYCLSDGGWTGSTDTNLRSGDVALNIRYPPPNPVTVTGNSDPVYDGDNIELRCSIRGGNPQASLTWTCPGRSVTSTPANTADTAVSVLRIRLTPLYNGANCTCTATHPVQVFRTSHTEVFNVYFAPRIHALTVTDRFPWLARDDYVGRLSCDTTAGNPSTTRYTWYRDGTPVSSLTSQVISFEPPVRSDDRGVYRCMAKNDFTDSRGSAPELNITLNVQYAPIITLSACPETVNETDNYRCTCTALGNPNPTVTWYPRDSSTNNILDLPTVNRNKAGRYTCNATSSSQKFGSLYTKSDLNLVVQYAPDVHLLVQNATEHDTHLVMTCNAAGVPNVLTYSVWTHMCGTILVRTLDGDVPTHGRTLTLASVSYQDSGTYTCQVHNSIKGRDGQLIQTGKAVFDVRGSPRLLKTKSLYVSEKEKHLNITMTFISHPSPTDMFIKTERRLLSTTDLNISFINGTVKDNIYGKVISRGGYRVHLDFPSFQVNQEGDYSLSVINGVNQNLEHSFKIVIEDVPDTPTNLSADKITTKSVVISWTSGLNRGRDNQSIYLWIKESTADTWTKYNMSQDVSRMVISDLPTASAFVVVLFAANEKGSSDNTTLQFTTLTAVQDPSAAPLIGGISGSIVGLLLIIIGIVLYRRMSNGKNKQSGNRSDATLFNNDRDEDDGMKMNILYESAGPYQPEDQRENGQPAVVKNKTPAGADHAEVKKKTPAGAVYAEVVPKKDRKAAKGKPEGNPEGKPEGSGDLYAEVQKTDQRKKKQKKQSKDNHGGTVYENAGEVGLKPEELYANADDTVSSIQKRDSMEKNGSKDTRKKNQDGLVYLDLEFQQKQDGTRLAVIHGIENRNDYSEVDFTKRAEPMATKDEDDKN